jgi:hypothetical protein
VKVRKVVFGHERSHHAPARSNGWRRMFAEKPVSP